jgi:hypothetical protein
LTNNDYEGTPIGGGGDEEQVCDLTLLLKFLEIWFLVFTEYILSNEYGFSSRLFK